MGQTKLLTEKVVREMHGKPKQASYETVAVSIASLIRNQSIVVGQQLEPMVALGNRFGVSRETVRHGLKILDERGVLSLRHGKGAVILSKKKAENYLAEHQQQVEIQEIYHEISQMIGQQESDLDKLKRLVGDLREKVLIPLEES
ncbi:GntR family transcriptional regulator [Streptococcus caprae]|uniref:GntR family transcriptional regulator n=1 Tax=Streptococcus caprae TaxID=1640501 RepID=A0ABV8CSV3_9STRE